MWNHLPTFFSWKYRIKLNGIFFCPIIVVINKKDSLSLVSIHCIVRMKTKEKKDGRRHSFIQYICVYTMCTIIVRKSIKSMSNHLHTASLINQLINECELIELINWLMNNQYFFSMCNILFSIFNNRHRQQNEWTEFNLKRSKCSVMIN